MVVASINLGQKSMGKYPGKTVPDRMRYMAGVFLRNFVDAKVMSVDRVISEHISEGVDCSVLMIPNFFVAKSKGGGLSDRQLNILYNLLLDRYIDGDHTILGVKGSYDDLRQEFGETIAEHIEEKVN